MENENVRQKEFHDEVNELKLKGSSAQNETRLLTLGSVSIVVGLVLAIYGGMSVVNNPAPADQRAFIATGSLLGLVFVVVGVGLFVRYSLAKYLRFWLARMVHESRVNTDRIVDAIEKSNKSS